MVDINKVYERVLFIANKEQRGYITPEEFNSFAEIAQLEVFESYFLKKFQTKQAPMTTDDYSDVAMNVEEKITFFDNVAEITKGQLVTGTMGYAYPSNFYRLAEVTVNGRMADEVSHKTLTYVNLSPLTAPTETQPVYTRHENGVVLYPTSYDGSVKMVYVRKPAQPKWAYMRDMALTSDPIYDSANSQDFELHPSDEQDLTYKILTLSGITIKQPDVAAFGQGKDSQLAATE